MISETVLEDHIEFTAAHCGEKLFQHVITVMGVVNYMISDNVLSKINE